MVKYSSNFDRIMEARDHVCCANTCAAHSASKNGAISKSLTSVCLKAIIALFTTLMVLVSSVSAQISKYDLPVIPNCGDGYYSGDGYIIDKTGKIILGQVILHSTFGKKEMCSNQVVISFLPQTKIDKISAKVDARKKKGKNGKPKYFHPDISTAKLQGYGVGSKKFVTKRIVLDGKITFLALEVLSEEGKTYKFFDLNDKTSDPNKYSIYREKPDGELELIR